MTSVLENSLKLLIIALNLIIVVKCRNITYELNPNCGKQCDEAVNAINLVHISSDGTNDTIHFLWSSMTGVPPTLIIAKTQLKTNLSIDWTKIIDNPKDVSNAIKFSPEPINSIGLQISRLFFFNDTDGSGSYDNMNDTILNIDWNDFVWESVKNSISLTSNSIKTSFTQKKGKDFHKGSVTIGLRVDSSDGRTDDLPHLAFTELSTSLELSVNGVKMEESLNFTKPRLMSYILVVNDGQTQNNKAFQRITSIDDEYTPGVFDVII